jgi:hypothetical protein
MLIYEINIYAALYNIRGEIIIACMIDIDTYDLVQYLCLPTQAQVHLKKTQSSGMGESWPLAATGRKGPGSRAGKRRHNGTSWCHVIAFGDPFLTWADDDLLGTGTENAPRAAAHAQPCMGYIQPAAGHF